MAKRVFVFSPIKRKKDQGFILRVKHLFIEIVIITKKYIINKGNKMAKELNEESGFKVSIKTLVAIGFAMATVISMWFMLQADIAEAKELPVAPPPDVTRMEFDMKDQNIRLTIQNTQEDVEEIKDDLDRIEEKIDQLK